MLLAIDIGNSNVVWGLFEGETLTGPWRMATELSKTSDDYGGPFTQRCKDLGMAPEQVTAVILSSVVPALTPVFEQMARQIFHRQPLIVSSDMDAGLTIRYVDPRELGTDRLANAAAAFARYKTALIIVDCGTATTFSVISRTGDYLGGAIAPGFETAAEALFARAAQLPRVEFVRPPTVIGRDTKSSIQSGLVYGYAGMIDAMVAKMQVELGEQALVIATGGLAPLLAPECRTVREVRPHLTLEGLNCLYQRAPKPVVTPSP
jgi:type III pantothenate kinase